MPTFGPYRKTTLSNGLRIVTEHMPGVRSASLGIWVTVGSRHETERENGISHFIEHLAFKGTATRSAFDIARTVERGGGLINAFTSKELTCFYVHVLDERVDQAFDVLADILRNPRYAPEDLEREKQVVLDEIRDHEDMPDDVAHEYFIKELFGAHPLSRPILGSPANVRGFTRDRVLAFVGKHYVPRRLVVAAAGHVAHQQLVKLVKDKLSFNRPHRQPSPGRFSRLASRIRRHSRPIQQAHMVIGTRALPYCSRDRFALTVMNTALGGGMSSRLFQNIREKHGIAYSIYSFADALGDTGFWGVYLATDPDRVDLGRKMVLDELRLMRETPMKRDELEGIKTQIKGNIMLGLESASARMMRLARMEIYLGRFHTLEEVSRRIDEITPYRVQKMANQILDEGKLITTIVEPERKRRSSRSPRNRLRPS